MLTWDEYAAKLADRYGDELDFLAEHVNADAEVAHLGGPCTGLRAENCIAGFYVVATNNDDVLVISEEDEAKGRFAGDWLIGVYRQDDDETLGMGRHADFETAFRAALAAAATADGLRDVARREERTAAVGRPPRARAGS